MDKPMNEALRELRALYDAGAELSMAMMDLDLRTAPAVGDALAKFRDAMCDARPLTVSPPIAAPVVAQGDGPTLRRRLICAMRKSGAGSQMEAEELADAAIAVITADDLASPAPVGEAVANEPCAPWQEIALLPESDDLFWFLRGDTVDGPRTPQFGGYDHDEWDYFAPAEAPPTTPPRAEPPADAQAVDARQWLLNLMGDEDFTIPSTAFERLVLALAARGTTEGRGDE